MRPIWCSVSNIICRSLKRYIAIFPVKMMRIVKHSRKISYQAPWETFDMFWWNISRSNINTDLNSNFYQMTNKIGNANLILPRLTRYGLWILYKNFCTSFLIVVFLTYKRYLGFLRKIENKIGHKIFFKKKMDVKK